MQRRVTVTRAARDALASGRHAIESGLLGEDGEEAPVWRAYSVDVATFMGTRTRTVVAVSAADAVEHFNGAALSVSEIDRDEY